MTPVLLTACQLVPYCMLQSQQKKRKVSASASLSGGIDNASDKYDDETSELM